MWVNGLLQGLMWRATSIDGTLTYSFAEAVEASYPGYYARFIGGAIFFIGMCVMAFNVYMTTQGKTRDETESPATPMLEPAAAGGA
jgi:cytochrome c oxidase cbb3-type subunit 1